MRLASKLCFVAIVAATVVILSTGRMNSQSAKEPYQRTKDEGTIHGTVLLVGKPAANPRIDESADFVCSKMDPKAKTEWIVAAKGRLANTFIYIKNGRALDRLGFETPSAPVVLDQQRCRFVPHVLGVQTNQAIEVRNSDPTIHNVHETPKNNPDRNQSQPAGALPLVRRFARPEVMIPIKCNQHPWMKAYVGVLSHPFFAVSDRNGSFTIAGLPAGQYTLAAWHEKLGEKTLQVTVAEKMQQQVKFTFRATDSW